MIYLHKNLISLGEKAPQLAPTESKDSSKPAITSKVLRKYYQSNGHSRLPDASELEVISRSIQRVADGVLAIEQQADSKQPASQYDFYGNSPLSSIRA